MQYGLIGGALGHSYSPLIHARLGDPSYTLRPLTPEEVPSFLKERAFAGINVTIPYKKDVIPYLDRLDRSAADVGAVNTITNRGGVLTGYNTDVDGFVYLMKKSGVSPAGKKVLVLGTGGASLAVIAALRMRGVREILSVSREKRPGAVTYEELSAHRDAQILVNTTPVGMFPRTAAAPVDPALFPALAAVWDVVYNPRETLLLSRARALGIPAEDGLSMLVAQAVRARELFTGQALPENAIPDAEAFLEEALLPAAGPVSVGPLTLGEGPVRICVPVSGRTLSDVLSAALAAAKEAPDLVEWRADGCEEAPEDVLPALREALPGIPLLYTLRTRAEGGAGPQEPDLYEKEVLRAVSLGRPDAADIEYRRGRTQSLLSRARRCGVRTVLSYHDFSGTPSLRDMVSLLTEMDREGADILKLAVMARCPEDAQALLAATRIVRGRTARPLITMAMGPEGRITRLAGGDAGCCLTFASAGTPSAPGQLSVSETRKALAGRCIAPAAPEDGDARP